MKGRNAPHETQDKGIILINNYFRAIADNKSPTAYMTPEELKWWKAIQECQNSVKIYVNEEYKNQIDIVDYSKPSNPGDGLDRYFRKSHLKPDRILSSKQIQALEKKDFFAPSAKQAKKRGYTKYHVTVSEVPVWNSDGTISKVKILSTCAPNLMGTSPADRKAFVDSSGHLKQAEYQKACKEIVELMAYAAKENNINPLKISGFGLGAYIHNLSKQDQAIARKLMHKAFSDATKKYNIKFDWISGDQLDDVQKWQRKNPSVGIVNNGSDRDIGGNYWAYNTATTEERLTKGTGLMFVQTPLNSQFKDNVRYINIQQGKENKQLRTEKIPEQKKKSSYAMIADTLNKIPPAPKSSRPLFF